MGQEALDRLAISLGGGVMMPTVFRYVPAFLDNQDWRYRMVGLMAISQTGEGVYKEMKKHLAQVDPKPQTLNPKPMKKLCAGRP